MTLINIKKALKATKPYLANGMRRIPYSDSFLRIPKKRISTQETGSYFQKYGSSDEFFREFKKEKLLLNPPKILNKNFNRSYGYLKEYVGEKFLIQLEKARFYLSSHSIFTKENYHLGIVSSHPELSKEEHIAFKMLYIPKAKKISGKGFLLVTQCDNNYYHCLFQIPAKIWFLDSIGFDRNSIDHYFLGLNNSNYQKEILTSLKLPQEKIIDVNIHSHIKVEKLLLTPMFYNPEPWMFPLLRKTFLENHQTESAVSNERIFVSRNNARVRRILNEEKLWLILEKHGFEYITLEGLSIREQAHIFSSAKIIVSAHGAALANIVFCTSGAKVLELRGVDHTFLHFQLYEHLSSIMGLNHSTLLVSSIPGKYSKNISENDLRIEEDLLEEIIDDFIIK